MVTAPPGIAPSDEAPPIVPVATPTLTVAPLVIVVGPVYLLAPVRVTMPPRIFRSPVPLMTLLKLKASERLRTSEPLLVTAPPRGRLPAPLPPAPTCSVPALMIVPPP